MGKLHDMTGESGSPSCTDVVDTLCCSIPPFLWFMASLRANILHHVQIYSHKESSCKTTGGKVNGILLYIIMMF